MAREVERWITVNRQHVPIMKGQSKEEAVHAALKIQKRVDTDEKKKSQQIMRNKAEADKKNGNPPKDFKEHAEEYVGGGIDLDEAMNKDDLEYVQSHQTKTDKPLYRVEDARFTANKLDEDDLDIDDFKFKGSFRSFSSDMKFISSAIDENSDNYAGINDPVVFEITGSKNHFDMSPYTGEYNKHFGSQSESLVGGRFQVTGEDMKKIGDRVVRIIKIRQK